VTRLPRITGREVIDALRKAGSILSEFSSLVIHGPLAALSLG